MKIFIIYCIMIIPLVIGLILCSKLPHYQMEVMALIAMGYVTTLQLMR